MREGDPLPVDTARLEPRQFVADVITRPEISPLLVEARRIGCATMPGAGMFEAQAELLVERLLGTGG
jgi:shikimate dehydrogenase